MEETPEQEESKTDDAQAVMTGPEEASEESAETGLDDEIGDAVLGDLFVRSVAFTSLSIISLSILGAAAWRVGLLLKRLAYVVPF